jgi:hypothetical protein
VLDAARVLLLASELLPLDDVQRRQFENLEDQAAPGDDLRDPITHGRRAPPMSESVAPAPAEPRQKGRVRKVLERIGLVVIGTPIVFIVGSIIGYIGGTVIAYLWSTPHEPLQDFAYLREWSAVICGAGAAVYFLALMATSQRSQRRRREIAEARADHYHAWVDAGYEHHAIPEFKTRGSVRFESVNTWIAVAAVIAAAFVFDVFTHLAGHQYLGGAAVLFGLPALAWFGFRSSKSEITKTWVLAGAALLLIFGARGVSTSFFHGYANCWTVRTTGEWDVIDCAPGSEPMQSVPGYSTWSDTETPGRECLPVGTYAGSASRWRCHQIG